MNKKLKEVDSSMDTYTPDTTISDSKEESIAKAIRLLEGEGAGQKPLVRPNISTAKILLRLLLWVLIAGVFLYFCDFAGVLFRIPVFVVSIVKIGGCLLIVVRKAKAFVKNAVLLYQKYAPEKVRRSCVFTPTCSEYMLLAVEKYGVVVGVYKGFCRLLRCHPPNGGEDYP